MSGTYVSLPQNGSSGALMPDGSVPITGRLVNLRAKQKVAFTLTGTATSAPGTGNNEVFTGTGTKFLTEVSPGDIISSSTGPNQFSAIYVVSVASDTSLTAYSAGGTWTNGNGAIITNHPVMFQLLDESGAHRLSLLPNGTLLLGQTLGTLLSVQDDTVATPNQKILLDTTGNAGIGSTINSNLTQGYNLPTDGSLQMVGQGSYTTLKTTGFNCDHTISTAVQTYTPTGTTVSIDCRAGNMIIINTGSATGSVAVTLTNRVTGSQLEIHVVQNGATARAVTFTGIKWSGGTAYSATLTAGAIDKIGISDDGINLLGDWKGGYA